jgi:capsular exopolysaccharide synthesis family protein
MITKHLGDRSATTTTKVMNPVRTNLLQEYNTLQVEITALNARAAALKGIIKDLSVGVQNLPVKNLEFNRLMRTKTTLEGIYNLLKQRFHEAKINKEMVSASVVQHTRANPPAVPVSKNAPRQLLIFLLVGLLVGYLISWLIDYLDNTIKLPYEMEKLLGIPLLGIIPELESQHTLLTPDAKAPFMEPYRALRTAIKYANIHGHRKSFIISSAIQGDGKTTKASNLAIVFSFDHKKVLLIDADLRRPTIHKLFNLPTTPGLTEYLTGQASWEQVVYPTQYENLSVVPAGNRPPNPTEILGSPGIDTLLELNRGQYDLILIDTPAIMPVSDALILASKVDATILVARFQRTPINAAQQTLLQLKKANTRILGGIYNGFNNRRGYWRYYYYGYYRYYYGNSYYYDETHSHPTFFQQLKKDLMDDVKKWALVANRVRDRVSFRYLALLLGVAAAMYLLAHAWPQKTLVRFQPAPEKSAGQILPLAAFAQSWAEAYNRKNREEILGFYSVEKYKFKFGGYAEWRTYLKEKLDGDDSKITVSVPEISNTGETEAQLSFIKSVQRRGGRVEYPVVLSLEKAAGQWKIIRERTFKNE